MMKEMKEKNVAVTLANKREGVFCVDMQTRETQYLSLSQVADTCCEAVIIALNRWQDYEWECELNCPHINN